MNVRTTSLIRTGPELLWPLLTRSRMTSPGCFCFGLPRPMACELPEREGGVGAERRCISDRGTVVQTITEWRPPERLRFRMVGTDQFWGRCMEAIEDDFLLETVPEGTRITRVTRYVARGWLKSLKELAFWLGLKRVHYYVFRNWRDQSEAR